MINIEPWWKMVNNERWYAVGMQGYGTKVFQIIQNSHDLIHQSPFSLFGGGGYELQRLDCMTEYQGGISKTPMSS